MNDIVARLSRLLSATNSVQIGEGSQGDGRMHEGLYQAR